MGAWDIGHFDNDCAADFCGVLDEASRLSERADIVRDALRHAVDTTEYLDSDIAAEAVAAAALVAAQCPGGEPADPVYGPEQPLPDLGGLRDLAAQALERVTTQPSELLELWAEAGDGPWRAGIDQLRGTLRRAG